ncbi:hypothetical protein [Rhizobium terrae]|uniref:hypothetical protein n=1 Tax=Rhizobium terrae TaxID=2171756 RepID=UPI000E3BEAA4|nr:hypothetical protein [Rhizobium terrae]
MEIALSLALTNPLLRQGGGVPAWVLLDATGQPVPFVVDAVNDRGWYSGKPFPTEASFLAVEGISGALASGVGTFGPYDVPGAPNEMPTDPAFASIMGYTAFGSGSSIALVGEELELTAGGSGAGWRFNLLSARKAYRFRLKGLRGTNTSGQQTPRGGMTNAALSSSYIGSTQFSGSMTEQSVIMPSGDGAQRYAGVGQAN